MAGLFEVRRDRSTGFWKLGTRVVRLEHIVQMFPVRDVADRACYRVQWADGTFDTLKKNAQSDDLYLHLCNACLNRESGGEGSLQPTDAPDGMDSLNDD
jgi:hypothetical protein